MATRDDKCTGSSAKTAEDTPKTEEASVTTRRTGLIDIGLLISRVFEVEEEPASSFKARE